jgi:hypothetical protein
VYKVIINLNTMEREFNFVCRFLAMIIDFFNRKYNKSFAMKMVLTADVEVVGILAYYARGRGFDSRTVQTFVCMNMSVCTGCFYV